MTKEQAILKACQVMRDYKRPDRMAERAMMQQNGNARKRSRNQEPSTPLLDTVSLLSLFLQTLVCRLLPAMKLTIDFINTAYSNWTLGSNH